MNNKIIIIQALQYQSKIPAENIREITIIADKLICISVLTGLVLVGQK